MIFRVSSSPRDAMASPPGQIRRFSTPPAVRASDFATGRERRWRRPRRAPKQGHGSQRPSPTRAAPGISAPDSTSVRSNEADVVARSPLTVQAGEHGYAVLFPLRVRRLRRRRGLRAGPLHRRSLFVREVPRGRPRERGDPRSSSTRSQGDRIDPAGSLLLKALDLPRIQASASVLSKSVVLDPLRGARGRRLRPRGVARPEPRRTAGDDAGARSLLREIGTVLTAQAQMVGRAEVTEKPEIVWEDSGAGSPLRETRRGVRAPRSRPGALPEARSRRPARRRRTWSFSTTGTASDSNGTSWC